MPAAGRQQLAGPATGAQLAADRSRGMVTRHGSASAQRSTSSSQLFA